MKLTRRSIIIYSILFFSTLWIAYVVEQEFCPYPSDWTQTTSIVNSEGSALGQCGDHLLVAYVFGEKLPNTLLMRMSEDGNIWSEPKMNIKIRGGLFSMSSIVREKNGAIIFWGWSPYAVDEEGLRKDIVYFIETNDCKNWSKPQSMESFPFVQDTKKDNVVNFLQSIIKLRNGGYAALWISQIRKENETSSKKYLFYSESPDTYNWQERESIPNMEDVGEASLFEENNGTILALFSNKDDIYLVRKVDGRWADPQYISLDLPLRANPVLLKDNEGEYWLFFTSSKQVYYSKSRDLMSWDDPVKVTREFRDNFYISTFQAYDKKVWLSYTNYKRWGLSCIGNSDCEVRITYYNPQNIIVNKIIYMLIPIIIALISTGLVALLLKFLSKDS